MEKYKQIISSISYLLNVVRAGDAIRSNRMFSFGGFLIKEANKRRKFNAYKDFMQTVSRQSVKRIVTKTLLEQHTPEEVIDADEDELSDNESFVDDEPEILDSRAGVYRSRGITVYVPEKCMTPGTCRYRIKDLPKDVPDDIRIIFYK